MISIIITYYTGLNILQSNLSLLAQTKLDNVEIIIVNDNPSVSLNTKMLPKMNGTLLRILAMPQNGGYAAACNFGAQNANGELLIFMDSDILVEGPWLDHLLQTYHSTTCCGAVSATILNLNQQGVVHWGLGIYKGFEVIKPFRDGNIPPKLQHGVYEFNMATSGCILIPKRVFDEVGNFDERFYNGFCDLDLTYRITRQNYKCVYCSDAIVYHRGKVSGATRLISEDDTRALFIKKWKDDLPNDGESILPYLYSANINFEPSKEYFLINFSRSLWAKEYHSIILSCLDATINSYYEFRNHSSDIIILEDFLPWSLCGLNTPILYYCDNIKSLVHNQHWYKYRLGKKDIIADKNGNLLLTDSLLK